MGRKGLGKVSKKHAQSALSFLQTALLHHKKTWAVLFTIIAIFIVAFMTFDVRTAPLTLDITDRWAEDTVRNNLQQQFVNQVRAEFPSLPEQQVQQRAAEEIQLLLTQEPFAEQYNSQVALISNNFKDQMRDPYNNTYLLAIDPYFFLRLTRNVIENGHPGEFLDEDGDPATAFMNAPSVKKIKGGFHTYFQAFLFTIASPVFDLSIEELPAVAFFSPIVIMVGSALVAFVIGKLLLGNVTGLLFGILVGLHPGILNRTMGGFSDTDGYNVFFPLLIMLVVLIALRSKSLKVSLAYMVLSSILLWVYSYAWSGYLFIFYVLSAAQGIVFLVLLVKAYLKHNSFKKLKSHIPTHVWSILGYGAVSLFVIAIISGITEIIGVVFSFLRVNQSLTNAIGGLLWPNIYTTVAELNPASFDQIVRSVGGEFVVTLSILGFMLYAAYMLVYKKHRSTYFTSALFIISLAVVWYGATIFLSLRGIRFTLLVVPIVAMGLALFAGTVISWLAKIAEQTKEFPALPAKGVLSVVMIIIFLFTPVFAFNGSHNSFVDFAYASTQNSIPNMNDAWYDTLENIRVDSQPDAIVTSWWDFGHQFIYYTERGASADGASQNAPTTYWLARVLVADNEVNTLSTLRMLHCGANTAFDKLFVLHNQDMLATLDTLELLLQSNTAEAEQILSGLGYSDADIADVLESTHCTPPEAYIIASEDMVGKAGVWGHFGLWNFTNAFLAQTARTQSVDQAVEDFTTLGFSESDARTQIISLRSLNEQQVNSFISPYPSYTAPTPFNCQTDNVTTCPIGVVIGRGQGTDFVLEAVRIEENNATIQIGQYRNGVKVAQAQNTPQNLVIIDEETSLYTFDGEQQLGVAYDAITDRVIVAAPQLAPSTFTKLFYFEGRGLEHISLFNDVQSVFGQRIMTFKVDWDSYLTSIGDI